MGAEIKYNIPIGKAMEKYGLALKDSLDFLGETGFMTSIAKGYRYYINRFVPKESGNLRKSARVLGVNYGANHSRGMAIVYWKETNAVKDYMYYQYEGEVWGPNKPIFEAAGPNPSGAAGAHSGWVSPPHKTNTGRKMGIPYTYTRDGRTVHIKGYTTPNTGAHWIDEFMKDQGDYGEKAVGMLAARYTYDWYCKASKGTKYAIPHYGSYQAFNRWRQIEDIRD